MIDYDLPTSVVSGGREYPIRTDYRPILDIIVALNDPDLTDDDKAAVALGIFYEDEIPSDSEDALRQCFVFIGGGEAAPGAQGERGPRLVDWEKDFRWIASPITRMLGKDVRSVKLHWWTFLAYYYEIGECTFSQIVRIRSARARGRKLDKADAEWARRNADLVRMDDRISSDEQDLLSQWTKGGGMSAEQ